MSQHQHPLRISFLHRSCHMFCLSHPPCWITRVMSVEQQHGLWSPSLCTFDRHVKPHLPVDLPNFPYIRFVSCLVPCSYTSSTCYPHIIWLVRWCGCSQTTEPTLICTLSLQLLKINLKEPNNYSFTNKSAVSFVKDCLSSQCIH